MMNEKEAEELCKKDKDIPSLKKAANIYKFNKKWESAANCYKKVLLIAKDEKNLFDLIECHKEAGLCLINLSDQNDKKEGLSLLEESAKLSIKNDRIAQGARTYRQISELYHQSNDLKNALKHYKTTADLYETTHYEMDRLQCLNEMARIYSFQQDYKEAIQIYDIIIASYLKSTTQIHCITIYMYDSLLNYFAWFIVTKKQNLVEEMEKIMTKYIQMHESFSKGREIKFFRKIMESIKSNTSPIPVFENEERIYRFEKHHKCLLEVIRKFFHS